MIHQSANFVPLLYRFSLIYSLKSLLLVFSLCQTAEIQMGEAGKNDLQQKVSFRSFIALDFKSQAT